MQTKVLNLDYNIEHLYSLPWNISEVGTSGGERHVDLNFRKSVFSSCEIPETNTANANGAPTCWRILKYENGYFKEHIDHQEHANHMGNEIMLPPKVQCSYEGGQLVINEEEEKIILPDETKWSYIYIPLGTKHQVKPVIGARISFVRPVYGKDEFKYDPKETLGPYELSN